MGKRELFIIIAFVLIGAAAYQLTAPAPKPGERRFSVTELFSGIRREIRSNAVSATMTQTGAIAVGREVGELRITASRGVQVTVTGERREDIGYEMPIESTGPDEATALDYAKRTVLTRDDLGSAMAVAISYPPEGTQRAQLVLHVPSRMAVRIENSGRLQVAGVASVDLRNIAGETTLSAIAGAVKGSHRSGDLTVTDVGDVNLTLASSRAKFVKVGRSLTLNARSGECDITDSRGAIDVTESNVQLTITGQAGAIRIGGDAGKIRLVQPLGELSVDVRRALVEVTLTRAVAATLITTEEPLRLMLEGPPGLSLDALATDGGSVLGSDFQLEPTSGNRESRLSTSIGGGGPRIVLRNSRGNIVISRRQ